MQKITDSAHTVPFSGTVKMIITDIDGTFLDNSKALRPAVASAARETVVRGIPLAFATGRMYGAVRGWVEELGLTSPQIVENGTAVIRPEDGTPVIKFEFGSRLLNWVISQGYEHGFMPLVFADGRMYATGRFEGEEVLRRNKEEATWVSEAELRRLSSGKIVFIATADARIASLEALVAALPGMVPAGMAIQASFSERGIATVVPAEAGKLQAIRRLCGQLGCTVNDVMAIGDGDNDAEMLAGVGCGVAMGNASPLARASAVYEVADNEHDGVVEALHFAWEHCGDDIKS